MKIILSLALFILLSGCDYSTTIQKNDSVIVVNKCQWSESSAKSWPVAERTLRGDLFITCQSVGGTNEN